jgi:hypothetical protein
MSEGKPDSRKPRVPDEGPPRVPVEEPPRVDALEPPDWDAPDEREHATRVDAVADERATRRERTQRPWIRPSSLNAPPPRPGMVQRWIRVSIRGADDPRNVTMRSREGWSPRPMDSIPADFQMLATRADAKGGHFVVDDLMLCEMPRETYEQRAAYYEDLTRKQMQAVEVDLEKAQAGQQVPIIRRHTTSVSHPPRSIGRRVEAADD